MKGASLVDRLQGSEQAKARLKLILQTLSGACTIAEACAQLGVGERAFHKLRERTLRDALRSLEPRRAGRPQASSDADDDAAVDAELFELRKDLEAARLREQIALTMPHLLRADGEYDAPDEADEPLPPKRPGKIKKTRTAKLAG